MLQSEQICDQTAVCSCHLGLLVLMSSILFSFVGIHESETTAGVGL